MQHFPRQLTIRANRGSMYCNGRGWMPKILDRQDRTLFPRLSDRKMMSMIFLSKLPHETWIYQWIMAVFHILRRLPFPFWAFMSIFMPVFVRQSGSESSRDRGCSESEQTDIATLSQTHIFPLTHSLHSNSASDTLRSDKMA